MSSEKNNNFHFDDCWKGVNPGSREPKHTFVCLDFSLFAESLLMVTPPTTFPPETGGRSNLFSTTKQKMTCPNGMQGTAKCSDAIATLLACSHQPILKNIQTKHLRTLSLFFPVLMHVAGSCQSGEDRNCDASRPQGWLLCDVAENRRVLYMEKWARATRVLCSRMCMELRSKLPRQNISAGISDKNPPGSDVVLLAGQRTRDYSLWLFVELPALSRASCTALQVLKSLELNSGKAAVFIYLFNLKSLSVADFSTCWWWSRGKNHPATMEISANKRSKSWLDIPAWCFDPAGASLYPSW